MRFAPVLPRIWAKELQFTHYHICFAELVLRDLEYARTFAAYRAAGDIVVMDSCVFEGQYISPAEWACAVTKCTPTFAIVPDVRDDMQATLDRYSLYRANAPTGTHCMGVAQGSNFAELIMCALKMLDRGPALALPVHYLTGEAMPRGSVFMKLLEVKDLTYTKIHLLGVHDYTFRDEIQLSRFECIMGFDTAKLTSGAIHGWSWPHGGPSDFKRPANFFELPLPYLDVQQRLLGATRELQGHLGREE